MTDVYDINTGKKLATIPYGNNNKRKQHHAKLHNKDFEDLKKAERVMRSLGFSTEHDHIKKLSDSVKDKETFVLSDFRGDK